MEPDSTTELSVLDLAAVREGGTVAESFANTVKLAQAAEAWGYRRPHWWPSAILPRRKACPQHW